MTAQELRQINMAGAIASNRLEGLETTLEMSAVMQRYADGEITADELVDFGKKYLPQTSSCAQL